MIFSLVSAQLQLTCDKTKADVTAVAPVEAKISCKNPKKEKHVVFFESKVSSMGKCRIDIDGDGDFDLNIQGMLSDRKDGELSEKLKMMVCNAEGEVKGDWFDLDIVRKFEKPRKECSSVGDPHILPFNNKFEKYDHYGTGQYWLAKSDVWDVQVQHDECYKEKSCNTKVGIRYLDSLWVADCKSPQFKCNSKNGCKGDHMKLQTSEGKQTATIPGNIEISTTDLHGIGLNVFVTIPGQEEENVKSSLCNPGPSVTGIIKDKFKVTGPSYFDGIVDLPPMTVTPPKTYIECQLPKSCDGVVPKPLPVVPAPPKETAIPLPLPTVPEKPKPGKPIQTEAPVEPMPVPVPGAPAPSPVEPKGPTGECIKTGYKPAEPKEIYKPIPKATVLVPSVVDVVPANTTDTIELCKSKLPYAEMQILSKTQVDFHLYSCSEDLKFTPLAVENARQSVLKVLDTYTKDAIITSSDPKVKETCQKIQKDLYLGDTKCECLNGGLCTSSGCTCSVGYEGPKCGQESYIPKSIPKPSPIANTNDYKKPEDTVQSAVDAASSPTDYSSASTMKTALVMIVVGLF